MASIALAGARRRAYNGPMLSSERLAALDELLIDLNRASAEENGPCRNITFDPLILPSGISPSDDPLLPARSGVYAVSLTRRDGEPVDPSAASKNPETRRGAP